MNGFTRYSKRLRWLVPALVVALTAACGGGGGRDPILGSGIVATLAPSVTSVTPVNAATGVQVNEKFVTATFNKAMDPATLTTGSFRLTCPAATPVTGTAVAYQAAGNVAVLTLPAGTNLPVNTVCKATVSSAVKDAGGNALDRDFVWTFTTVAAFDTTAPTVTSTGAPNGATGLPINRNSTATFSEEMDASTISTATYTVKQGVTPVAGTVSYVGTTATFDPTVDLAPSTTYTGTVTTGAKDLAGNALASNYVWSWTTGAAVGSTPPVDTTPPIVTATGAYGSSGFTSPDGNRTSFTGLSLPINRNSTVTFNEQMDPATLTSATYTVTQAGARVVGLVSYVGTTATFNPAVNLAANTTYTSTITTGAKDLVGNALAAAYVWSWTTSATLDTTAPTVQSTVPANAAIGVPINQEVSATFSEEMDPLTVTNASFTLKIGAAPVAGNVTYIGNSGTFSPSSPLAASTTYTAEVSNAAKDLAGNALATGGLASNPWTFTTAAAVVVSAGPAAVNLDCAANFAILAGSTVTNTGPTIISGGDLGLSPGSAVTGFPPGTITGGTIRVNDVLANNAKLCLTTAYNDAAGRTLAPITVSGNIGGQTLAPGLYKSTSTLAISSGDLTLAGPADAVWIFQIASTLTTTAGRQVILTGGAQAKNVFWQVGTSATLGTTSAFQGNIMADQSITLNTGAKLSGRALTRIGAVSLDSNNVTKP